MSSKPMKITMNTNLGKIAAFVVAASIVYFGAAVLPILLIRYG